MSTFIRLLVLYAIFVTPLFAQDATSEKPESSLLTKQADPIGLWEWEQTGFGGRARPRQIELRLEDGNLIGTAISLARGSGNAGGPPTVNDPVPLRNVLLQGDKISFDVTRKFGDNEFTEKFAGVIAGDEIAGVSAIAFGGQSRESAWLATRKADVTNEQTTDAALKSDGKPRAVSLAATGSVDASSSLALASPTQIPDAGQASDQPYAPRPILPGGIVLPLYPPDSPYLNLERIKETEKYNLSDSVHGRINSIVNIHNPSIEVHFASPSMNTGTAVILAAGGGHRTLNVGTESADFVPFFFNFGVNTVILRNRLRSDGYEPATDAVRDALQAIRLVRKNAESWKIDPNRIGIMGFSAGAELSAPAAIQFAQFDQDNDDSADPLAGITSRPDFVGIIYPGPTPFTREPETGVPLNTPPAFITCAGAGDRIHAIWATDYFSAMLKASIPNVEMHIYGNGYHPGDRGSSGGLTHRGGIPFGTWQNRLMDWIDDLGFLSAPGVETKAFKDTQEFVSQSARPARDPAQPRRQRVAQPDRGDNEPSKSADTATQK
ncbi:MAG: alpha/beta hydrolase [Aureliella sp.]